jgi:hypothetical protein
LLSLDKVVKIEVEVIDYQHDVGLRLSWADGAVIEVSASGEVMLSANPAGLITLANHLLTLAQPRVPSGSHVHLDESSGLFEGSAELVIIKV